jgi:hypothetical protein
LLFAAILAKRACFRLCVDRSDTPDTRQHFGSIYNHVTAGGHAHAQ